ncbi:hypothetical protein [Micromonospora sp. NPDC005171]|uniref:hypothetical protein n=1 Tax=Micromonospora sp. NPDC005171 TaxID=3156866 RepID=UPI0033B09417
MNTRTKLRAGATVPAGVEIAAVDLVLSTWYGAGEVADAALADNSVQVSLSASDDS